MENEKKKPSLPEDVAKKFTYAGVPGLIITRPHPKTGKRKTVDLTKITLEEAAVLVEAYKVNGLAPIQPDSKAIKESK